MYYHTNIGFATSATAASTTIPAAKRKTTNINKNGIPGKQRNLAAPEAVLGNFQYAGNIPDDMAPVRGRTKSQKVGMNCSAMINADMRTAMHINHTRNAMYPSMKNCTYMVYAMYLQYARSRVRMNRPINCRRMQGPVVHRTALWLTHIHCNSPCAM